MHDGQAGEAFVQDLQNALRNLYDPANLRKSRMLLWLALDKRANPVGSLRELLTSAVQALKPSLSVPPDSNAWRVYWVLTYRYIEQSNQATVAAKLGLSDRQLRRQERMAEQALADYLWDRCKLSAQAYDLLDAGSPGAAQGVATELDPGFDIGVGTPSREQELEWLHESLPMQSASVAAVLGAVLKLVSPLAEVAGVRVTIASEEELPPISGQLPLVRQALLNLLSGAVHSAPGGNVAVEVGAGLQGIAIRVRAVSSSAPDHDGQVGECLDMARQFAGLFGGALEILLQQEGEARLVATLALPLPEQIEVLVIDDNADTLRLLQRYLTGTRFHFIGARDPEDALALAIARRPRAIVLDVMMPGIDDWELLGRLRTHPQTSSAHIVVSTILPQEQLARALGAAGFVRKPVSRQTLLSVLDQLVDQQ